MNILNLPLFLAQTDPYTVPELTDAEAAGLIGGLIAVVLALAVPLLILAFGSAQYQGIPTAATLASSPPAPPADPPAEEV